MNTHPILINSAAGAVGDMESLKKAMRMSRAFCFNSCFIHYRDDTWMFSKSHDANDAIVKAKVSDYLQSRVKNDGTVERYTERWYGWILWDIRNKGNRLAEDIRYE